MKCFQGIAAWMIGVALVGATPAWAEETVADDTAAPAAADEARVPEDWSIHGQFTSTYQIKPNFHSAYQTSNSLDHKFQARDSNTATLFLGARLWSGAEAYVDPEISEGYGLSHTYGLAGFSNGEAQKGGSLWPKYYPARYYLKQVIGLGGEQEWIEGGPNQLAGSQDVSRLTLIGGGFAASDFFQTNSYANDPRSNFTNWALWESAGWDVPGNQKGYTRGLYAELNQPDWAIRYGAFAVPNSLNASDVTFGGDRTLSQALELEGRYRVADRPGKLKLMGFYTRAAMGNYREALRLMGQGIDASTAILRTRQDGHEKMGFAATAEQEIADELGVFARLSWNDGRNEAWGFTDADASLAGGISLKGGRWSRPDDTIGVGAAVNTITAAHRAFLAAGGSTLLLGDGGLTYGHETDLEAYYAARLMPFLTLTGDYQLIDNPGYNKDRGPVHIFGGRLHAEF